MFFRPYTAFIDPIGVGPIVIGHHLPDLPVPVLKGNDNPVPFLFGPLFAAVVALLDPLNSPFHHSFPFLTLLFQRAFDL